MPGSSRTKPPYRKKLWKHQRHALDCIVRYLEKWTQGSGSALVHIPTGGGKSGVITVAARCLNLPSVLALTPRKALRRQLAHDIKEGFFQTIELPNDSYPVTVRELLPSNAAERVAEARQGGVTLVSTFQALLQIRSQHPALYDRLRRTVGLVMADEGHYEPGPEWSVTVRELKTPTVLFTATPYRNDVKAFDINPKHVSSYSFHQGVADHRLRSVEFADAPATASAREFVRSLLAFYHAEFQEVLPVPNPKVIVRGATFESVSRLANALEEERADFVAVHHRFPSTKDPTARRQRAVPDPRTRDTTFWVHQYKLMEGVDDPAFALVAMFEPLKSARSLVQQIGRVVRNASRKKPETAYVYVDRAARSQSQWDNYLAFERQDIQDALAASLETLYQVQQSLSYLLGEFRHPLNPDDIDLGTDLLARRSVRVYRPPEDLTFDSIAKAVERDQEERDRQLLKWETFRGNTMVWLWVSYGNSPLLASASFVEPNLGYTICRLTGDLLFHSDSQNAVPELVTRLVARVPGHQMQRLYSRTRTRRMLSLSLKNTDLGRHAVRSKSISAYDIATSTAALNDHAHFPSTARALIRDKEGDEDERTWRRYVGFGRARVTDETARCTVDEYMNWLDVLARELNTGQIRRPMALTRFAEMAAPPADTEPANILLDLDDVLDEYVTAPGIFESTGRPIQPEELCVDVSAGTFAADLNGYPFEVSITWDRGTERYVLADPDLEMAFEPRRIDMSLLAYLNSEQSFRVVPREPGYIYAHGHWYRPRLAGPGERQELWTNLLSVFVPDEALTESTSEKGRQCRPRGAGWEKGCLFDIVDRPGKGSALQAAMPARDVFICDDPDKEIADFIAVSEADRRAVFMHLKAFGDKGKKRSASAFAEVSSQAVKNLDYLNPYGDRDPPNVGHWAKPWSVPGVEGTVRHRIRTKQSPTAALATLQRVVRNPAASREVWVVMGKGFSRGDFATRIANDAMTPEDLQIMYQVRATWYSVAAMGAQFKIFCSP